MTFGSNERAIEVLDPVGTTIGDRVEIGIKPARVVWASTVAYIFPVVAMLAGAMLGAELAPEGKTDAGAAVGAFLAFGLSLAGIWLSGKITGSRDEESPVIIRVKGRGSEKTAQSEVCDSSDEGDSSM